MVKLTVIHVYTMNSCTHYHTATIDGHRGRMIYHSKTHSNMNTKLIDIAGTPHLCFFSTKVINDGEELLYDYGDRRKDVTLANLVHLS